MHLLYKVDNKPISRMQEKMWFENNVAIGLVIKPLVGLLVMGHLSWNREYE